MAKKRKSLIQEAIADAKEVRDSAVAQARITLEEAFAPQFSALIAQRLREEDELEDFEDDDLEELNNPVEGDGHGSEDGGETDIEGVEKSSFTEEVDDKVDNDSDLDSSGIGDIPADHGMKTAPGPKEPTGGSGLQSSDIDNEGKLGMNEDFDEFEDEEGIEDDEIEMEQDEFDVEDEEEIDDLDLETVIAELEADLEDDDEEEFELGENDDELDFDVEDDEEEFELGENWPEDPAGSAADGHGTDEGGEKDAEALTQSSFTEDMDFEDDEEEFDLEEILREIEDEEEDDEMYAENKRLKTELKEHQDAIVFLRSKLNELNLLNAKLLFTTKLFRNFNLNSESKMRVIENFDRASTVREAKLVYTTLAEAFNGGAAPKKQRRTVTESIASRRSGSTKPKQTLTEQVVEDYYKPAVLTEGEELKSRMQKLAGINK